MISKILEWASTIFLIGGAIFLAYDQPMLSSVSYFSGSVGWALTAFLWKRWSLFVTNTAISLIFISGWLNIF